ncbi:MAG TPA: tetratricopeptide repeat protein [Aliidongia sp.]|nr:tetratricopeptide repeat protein [Aliidongia sp.]
MPLYLIEIALQIACVIHIIKTGRNYLWLTAVIFLPLVGMAAYFLAEILPALSGSYRTRRLAGAALGQIDRGRGVRQRVQALDMADTIENRRRLAEEYQALGQYDEALALYERSLTGIHADDPTLLLGVARAAFGLRDGQRAVEALDHLRAANPDFQSTEGHLLYAKSLEAVGRRDEALAEYAALVEYAPGEEARCRYALLLQSRGEVEPARALFAEILERARLGTGRYRTTEREWIEIARRSIPA